MKIFILLSLLLSSVSCALLKDLKNQHLGFNYNEIGVGEAATVAISKRGYPTQIFESGDEKLFLYKDGFIHSQKDIVINKGSYNFSLAEGELLSSYVRKGSDLFELIPLLGLPLSVTTNSKSTIVRYNRGAILADGPKVLVVSDKVYSDLVFNIALNAYTDKTSENSGYYYIMPGSEKVNPEDFQFKELKQLLAASLKLQGFRVTENVKEAKYILLANYGISDPQEDIQVISRPVYIPSYIPGNSYNFYSSNGSFAGSMQSSGRWTSQYAGQHTETIKTVTFVRWLNIEAVDYSHLMKTKKLKPVWKVLSSSEGSSGDLRFVLPVLVYGASGYINSDTRKELDFSVSSNSLNEFIYETQFIDVPSRSLAGKK